ncbi:MAG: helix-turn-helix domain-containing protein [Candidatus Pacebacteria bacterium]|nr:helix-turn-helix domain-containing protein [Candidatus Paceibacterota bacterium]
MEIKYSSQEKQQKDEISCGDFLKKARLDKGYSVEKVSEETKILSSIIKDLEGNNYENLPPPVYLKGVINKYAQFLKLDPEKVINLYQQSNGRHLSSGKNDLPPKNRFSVRQSKLFVFIKDFLPKLLKWIFLALILLYFVYEASFFILPAKIILYSPVDDLITNQPELEIAGKVIRGRKFFVKDKEVYFQENGEFNDTIILNPGLNIIEFRAINALNRDTLALRRIIYTPSEASE